jgi:hypothetical protein
MEPAGIEPATSCLQSLAVSVVRETTASAGLRPHRLRIAAQFGTHQRYPLQPSITGQGRSGPDEHADFPGLFQMYPQRDSNP